MKSNCKRGVAVLLAVLMLFCAFPLTSLAADKCKTCGSDLTGEKKFTQPTCTEPGYVIYVCSNPKCEGEKKQNEPAAGHKWTEKVEDKYMKDPAYCKGPATYYKSCSVCGASAKGEANADKLVFNGPADQIDKNNHRNIDVKIPGEPATCTKEGKTGIGTCKDCQTPYVGGTVIPKLPHTEGTPANCVDKAICKVCKQSYGEPNPNNHKSVKTDPAKQATCKATGLTEGSHCEACKKTIKAQETVPLAAHTPTTKNVPATCTKDGVLNEMTCAVCGQILEPGTVLPKTGHKWGNWSAPADYSCAKGGTVSRVCSVCKEKETKTLGANEHALVVDEAVPATCTKDGKAEGSHCGICNTVIKEQTVVPALGHDFTGEVKPNKDGTHAYKCSRCDEVGGQVKCVDVNRDCVCDQCRENIPHTFTNYIPDGNATCKEDGTKTAVCDICGQATDKQPDVGSKDKAEHDFKFVAQNDATCMVNAHEIGTCTRCGATITREIAGTALGHDEGDWQVPEGFDCEVGGYRFKICKRCGEETNRETLAATEHTKVVDPAVKETCTTDGKTAGEHCSVCGEVFVAQAVIPAPGHKADANGFTTVTAASCEKAGEEKATCSVCAKTFTREIPATGHNYKVDVVPPTCTEKGYSLHKCTVCGHSFKDASVKATGHSWKITIKPATMKKAGSKVYVCKVCKKKVTKTIDMIKTVKLASTTLAKTGKKVTPTLIVKNSAGKKLKEGTAYTVKYAGGRKNLGTYKLTVTFIGNYKGTKTLSFTIVPAAPKTVKATAKNKTVTVNWSKVSGGDQYIVYRATSKNGSYKKVGTTTKTSLAVSKLNAGTYYFKVRAIRVLDSGNLNGVASAAAKVKVK
ncbi:MAG: fibronectin type III domain-containing protein [Clostridia bacterium]|nr:fibronectin type III domain-containing protein [Clostridia bacterium]